MKSIADLLAKYKNLKPTDGIKKEAVIEVLRKKFDLVLKKDDLSVTNNVVYLKCSPQLRSEIYLHKADLMADLREILGDELIRDLK